MDILVLNVVENCRISYCAITIFTDPLLTSCFISSNNRRCSKKKLLELCGPFSWTHFFYLYIAKGRVNIKESNRGRYILSRGSIGKIANDSQNCNEQLIVKIRDGEVDQRSFVVLLYRLGWNPQKNIFASILNLRVFMCEFSYPKCPVISTSSYFFLLQTGL